MAVKRSQLVALLLSLMGSLTVGIGVAHLIVTYFLVFQSICESSLSKPPCKYAEVIIYAFIVPGVWGAIMVFATGLLAVKAVGNMKFWRTVFKTVAFLTVIVSIPAMIAISIVNAVKVAMPPYEYESALYNVTSGFPQTSAVLFALPIAVSGMGLIEWILTIGLLVYISAHLKTEPVSTESGAEVEPTQKQEQEQEQEQQYEPRRRPQFQPYGFVQPRAQLPYSVPFYPIRPVVDAPYTPLPYGRPYIPTNVGPNPDLRVMYRPGLRTGYQIPGRLPPGRLPPLSGPVRPYPVPYYRPAY